jgi:lysophospholipase L1-like esterase
LKGAGGKSRLGNQVGTLLLFLVSLLVALVLAEIVFRAFATFEWRRAVKYHRHELYQMLPDDPREYGLHPGVSRENLIPDSGLTWTYRINSDGFRGDEFDVESHRKRILFIGDSYTFGWGVDQEETLTRAVERALARPPFRLEADAWNLGVPGYNTEQEFHLLNQVLDLYSPDMVVLGFVMNDAQPQYNVHERPSVRYRYVRSWLLAFLKEQMNLYLYEGEPVLHTGINTSDKDFLAAVRENQPKWAAARQAFMDMAALSRGRDIPFLLVTFPSYNNPFTRRYPFHRIHREVAGWAADEGVQSLDLLEYMVDKDNRVYRIEGDGHPNGRAFAEAAAILAPVIAESLATGELQ